MLIRKEKNNNKNQSYRQILISKIKLKLAAAEEAHSLSLWSTATICRVLSLQNVMSLFFVLPLILL